PFYERSGGWGLGDTPTYNNMELTGLKGPENKYWFELLRRQARNIWLNMEHGTDLKRGPGVIRKLWKRARAEPLWRRPWRGVRKGGRKPQAARAARRQTVTRD